MTRPSPQTDRVRWIINLFTTAPRESFSLAQIARHLGVSKATCLPAVASLTQAGWLVRHPVRKTYRLGPALIEIGRAAEVASPTEGTVARLERLSAETRHGCILWQVSDDDLVLADVVGPGGPRSQWAGLERGHRIQPIAPLGSTLVAWSDERTIDRWIGSAGGQRHEVAEQLRIALASVRRCGYAVELQDDMAHGVFRLVERLRVMGPRGVDDLLQSLQRQSNQRLVDQGYLVVDPDADATYYPVSINAPIFDRYGAVDQVLCLVDFDPDVNGADVRRFGEAVRECADDLTRSVGGLQPQAPPPTNT